MSRGYRSIVFAIVGWLILCGAQPLQKQAQTTEDNEAFAKAREPPFAAFPGYNPDRCYHAKDHDAADLCAQWRAAIAAEKAANAATVSNDLVRWSNGIAGAGALLTIVSVGLLIWTLLLTRRQLKIARDDRDEARSEAAALARDTASALAQTRRVADAAFLAIGKAAEANDISRDAMKRELRAYVRVQIASGNVLPGQKLIFAFDIINYGKTPALQCVSKASIVVRAKGWRWEDEGPATTHGDRVPLTIHSNVPSRIFVEMSEVLSGDGWDAIMACESVVFVRGDVAYQTVFGDSCLTRFNGEFHGEDAPENGGAGMMRLIGEVGDFK